MMRRWEAKVATMMMTPAYWFTEHERSGFPIEKAALGPLDPSVDAKPSSPPPNRLVEQR
jgi:hypothetical protein